MKLKFKSKNVEIGQMLKEKTEKKLSKLDKYFKDDVELVVFFDKIKNKTTVELTVFLPGHILRAEETSNDLIESLDKAIARLESQIRKHKTKLQKRYNKGQSIRFEGIAELESYETEVSEKLVKEKTFTLAPMNLEEAMLQMDMLGHNFYIFLNSENGKVEVIYQRRDGDIGLIKPRI